MIIGTLIGNNEKMAWETVKCFFEVASFYPITGVQGCYIYENRNQLFKYAKKHDDSILMIDSDIVFKISDVEKIKEHLETKDIVTGVYCLGNPPFPAVIMRKTEKNYAFAFPPKELAEIDACGGGFLGISREVVRAMENPFNNVFENGEVHGEDISFAHRAKHEYGFKVYCDPSISLGQVRNHIIYYGDKRANL